MSDYQYVRLSSSNFGDLENLITIIYGSNFNKEQLKKKYATECFGLSFVGYLAYHKTTNEVAAYYGVLPLRFSLKGKILLAAQSGDTMTHPEHRNKGLFVELAKKTYELGKELGIQFVFGFPNKNSYPGLVRKLGWTHAYDMLSLNMFIPTLPYARFIAHKPKWSHWHRRAVLKVLNKLFSIPVTLPETLLPSNITYSGVMHDRDFFSYKLGYNCVFLQHKTVYIVLKIENNNLGIGNLVNCGKSSDLTIALLKLKLVCFLMGIMRIKTYCSPNELKSTNLKKYGFCKTSLPYCHLNFNAEFNLNVLDFTYIDYDTF